MSAAGHGGLSPRALSRTHAGRDAGARGRRGGQRPPCPWIAGAGGQQVPFICCPFFRFFLYCLFFSQALE